MPTRELPSDVMQLLDRYFDSLGALDTFLLLHADPSRWWTAVELATSAGLDRTSTDRVLTRLCEAELVETLNGRTVFRAARTAAATALGWSALVRSNATDRGAVVQHVRRRSLDHIELLAEAFTRGKGL